MINCALSTPRVPIERMWLQRTWRPALAESPVCRTRFRSQGTSAKEGLLSPGQSGNGQIEPALHSSLHFRVRAGSLTVEPSPIAPETSQKKANHPASTSTPRVPIRMRAASDATLADSSDTGSHPPGGASLQHLTQIDVNDPYIATRLNSASVQQYPKPAFPDALHETAFGRRKCTFNDRLPAQTGAIHGDFSSLFQGVHDADGRGCQK
jgi:hypothetical protein